MRVRMVFRGAPLNDLEACRLNDIGAMLETIVVDGLQHRSVGGGDVGRRKKRNLLH